MDPNMSSRHGVSPWDNVVVKTRSWISFDLPDIDENVRACRDQISIVLIVDSGAPDGYKTQVQIK